jgi:hypothetical protein
MFASVKCSKSKVRRAGRIACMAEMRNAHKTGVSELDHLVQVTGSWWTLVIILMQFLIP